MKQNDNHNILAASYFFLYFYLQTYWPDLSNESKYKDLGCERHDSHLWLTHMKDGIISSILSIFLQIADRFSIYSSHISIKGNPWTPVLTRLHSIESKKWTPTIISSTMIFCKLIDQGIIKTVDLCQWENLTLRDLLTTVEKHLLRNTLHWQLFCISLTLW